MLNKSILLNINLAKREFMGAIIFSLVCGILSLLTNPVVTLFLMFSPGMMFLFIGFIGSLIFQLKGMNRVFNKSLFAEGGDLLMTLPISSRDMVLGKIIAVSMATLAANLILLIFACLPVAFVWDSLIETGITEVGILDLNLINMTPAQATLAMALLPPQTVLSSLASCSVLFAAMLTFNLRRPGRPGIIPWILYFAVNSALNRIVETLTPAGINPLYTDTLIPMALSLILLLVLVPFCCNILKTKYNY